MIHFFLKQFNFYNKLSNPLKIINKENTIYSLTHSSKIFTLLITCLLFTQVVIGQVNDGDFRSKQTGNWGALSSWETYNGSIWENATVLPGQNPGSYEVKIQIGHVIRIRTNLTTASMGTVIVIGRLNLIGDSSPTQINLLTSLLHIDGGELRFGTQKTELYLPTNAVIKIDNGGDIIGKCSNNTEIYIGGELIAVCRGGGGSVLTFGEVVAGGGTINSIITEPSISPYTSCIGQQIDLLGMFGGSISTANVNYEWSVIDPSLVDIAISNSTGTLVDRDDITTATSFTALVNGNYLVSLSVTDGSYTNVETKTVTITDYPVETTGVTILQGGSGILTSSTACSFSGSSTKYAGYGSSGGGSGNPWNNTGNIYSDDGNYSYNNLNNSSENLNATNFGFSIPLDATINGITVSINRWSSASNGQGTKDVTVSLIKNSIITGDNKATSSNWSTNQNTVISYGGSTDKWNTSITANDINKANFGVTFDINNNNKDAYVDYIAITVSYSIDLKWYTTSSGGSSIGSGSSFNPVGVAGSGLPDTNTPGTYTYYAECSLIPGCRTPTDFIITDPSPLTEGPGGVVSNLQLWLKADEGITKNGSDGVTNWATQARGTDATVNTTGQEPTYRDDAAYNVNFNPVVEFSNGYTSVLKDTDFSFDNTSTQFLEGASGFYSQDVFIVVIPDDTPINNSFGFMDLFCADADLGTNEEDATGIGLGDYSGRVSNEIIMYAHSTYNSSTAGDGYAVAEIGTGSNYNNVGIINAYNNIALPQQELRYNASIIGNTQNNSLDDMINVSDTKFWIGRSEGWEASLNGRITEIITYSVRKGDTDLTDERNRIQSYLGIKYGITLGVNGTSQDYVDSDGNVIWDIDTGVVEDDVFNYDISGIGRDDVSELNQKQSKTVNTGVDITIGLVDIETTNKANSNSFTTDKSFLVWGNDHKTLAKQTAVPVDMSFDIPGLDTDVEFSPSGRTWKLVPRGSFFSAKVSVPSSILTPLGLPPGDYLMFISDTPTFSPDSEYRILKDDGTGNYYNANYKFTKPKFITFGFAPERTFERSIQFNGVDGYLDSGDVLNLNNSFTISAWIKRSNTNSSIVSKRDNVFSNGGYDFKIDGDGKLEMSWENGSTQKITSSVVIPTNEWHQVAIIYNGTEAKLFIDGVEDVAATKALSAPSSNSESFLIAAADGLNTASYFQGNIDEVRVWDKALTEKELRFIMNQEIEQNGTATLGRYFSNNGITVHTSKNDITSLDWSNLKGYYPMSTYTFTNSKDASGNGNTAALKNLTTVDHQSAPLPYVSIANTNWDLKTSWNANSEQPIPGATSIIDNNITVDWNIVKTAHNITMNNSSLPSGNKDVRSILGLIVETNKLTIEGDNTLGTGYGLNISHYLELNGEIDLEGESQLIQVDNSKLVVGASGELERDQQGEGNKYRYNDWSSPVSTGTINSTFKVADVLKDGINGGVNINFVGGYDGNNSTNPIQIANYWIYAYRNKPGDDYSQWEHIGSGNNLNAGEGFLMKGTGSATNQNYVFKGVPNNGDISLPITMDNDYLVGNPYPSALDADQFLTDNSSGTIDGTLYFWEHYGGDSHNLKDYQAGYATYNFSGGVGTTMAIPDTDMVSSAGSPTKLPKRYIAIGQGFTVKGELNGSIIFNNGQRAFQKEDVTNSIFMRTDRIKKKVSKIEENLDVRQKFRIGFDVKNKGRRELLLTIDDRATSGLDWGFDGAIYDMLNDDMYWVIEEEKHVIQGTNNWNAAMEVPLGIITKDGGSFSIKIDALENVEENTSLFIKNLLTGETYDITNNPFEIDLEAGEYNDRFALTFQPRLKTLEEIELFKGVNIFMNNDVSELHVHKIVDTDVLEVNLFNYLGQNVQTMKGNYTNRNLVFPLNLSSGVYITKVITSDGILTKKIIIE